MEGEAKKILLNSITEEEYKSIDESVLKKIANLLEGYVSDYIAAKAYFESSCTSHELKTENLEKQLREVNQEKCDLIIKYKATEDKFNETNKKLVDILKEFADIKDSAQRLEHLANTYRREKNEAVSEQQCTANVLAMREAELDRLKNDLALLNTELKAAIQAKCEATANQDDILAQQIDFKIKLEILELQNSQYSKQILELNADLDLANNELAKQKTEFKNEITALKSKIIGKEEELKKMKKEISILRDHNRELDSSNETPREPLKGLHEDLQHLLRAQYRLIDVYKKQLTESDAHSVELNGTIKELQHLLQESVNGFGEMETNANQLKQDFETTLLAKQQAIRALKQELKDANNLLDALKQEFTESQQKNTLPVPAPLNDLIKSGLTLTQMYTKFVEVNRDLGLEKQEKESFKIVLEAVLKEAKERSQLNLRQQEEYEFAKASMETLQRKVSDLEKENVTLSKAKFEAISSVEHLTQSSNRLKDTVKDLSRQVCHLLQKVESTRGNYLSVEAPHTEMKRCTDVISTHLTIFNDVNELKLINLRLLVSVIELANDKEPYKSLEKNSQRKEILELEVLKKYLISYKGIEQLQLLNVQLLTSLKELSALREREELESNNVKHLEIGTNDNFNASLKIKELQDHILRLNAEVEELQKKEEHLLKQIEVMTNQRDALHSSQVDTATDKNEQNRLFCGEAQAYLLIEDLRKEYESYKLNKTANEQVLLETLDKLRADFDTAIKEREQLACNLEQQQVVNDFIKNKLKTIQNEKEKLEKEVFSNKNTVKQLVGNVSRTNNEVKEALNKLSAAQVTIARLKEENALLKHNESKLLKERESKGKDKLGQELFLASLENLKEKFESSETSTTSKLESRLEVANNECTALRQRLREEQDRFSNRMDLLEKQTITAKQRLEEEVALKQSISEELKASKALIKEREQRLELLSEELKDVKNKFQHISEKENEIKDLQEIIKGKDVTINELQKQLDISKECMTEMCAVSQEMEKHLADIVQKNDLNTQEAEKKITDLQAIENDLRSKVNSLERGMEVMHALKSEECAAKDAELSVLNKKVESLSAALNIARNRVITTENETRKAGDDKKAAEQRAERLASEKNKMEEHLNEVHSNFLSVKNQMEEATAQITQLKDMFKHQQQTYEDKIKTLNEQAKHDRENIQDLTKLNLLLDEQIQKLEAKVSILNVSETASISFGCLDDSIMIDPSKETDKLLELVRIMRKEKQTTSVQFEILRGEKLQLEAEVDVLKGQLKEMIKKIEDGRISSGGELSPFSAEKHNQLLKKMETINQLTENNHSLQECKELLEKKVSTLEQQLSNIDDQIIAPLKMKNLELETMLEQISFENSALKGETKRWQDRTNQLIERTSKNPNELHRLKQENEDISKQLGCEKEYNKLTRNKLEEQIIQLRREKEEVISSLKTCEKNLITFRQELNTAKDCLKETTDKVKQLERAIAAKEASIIDIRNKETQLRNIAKKYKAQFQEVTKSLEVERKTKLEANLAGPTAEIETKLANLNEKMLQIKQENETLQKKIGILQTSLREKDHAKIVMNSGKNESQQWTKENKAFEDIGSVTGEGTSTTIGVQSLALRMSNMEKENIEDVFEKERLEQELRVTSVKLSDLHSQLDKRQAMYSEKSATASKFSEGYDDHVSVKNQLFEKITNVKNGRNAATTSQYATSSTSNIGPSPAEVASKRVNRYSENYEKYMPPIKRCRMASLEKSTGKEVLSTSYNLEVEYQVPTSSQRDHDDHSSVAGDTALGEYQEFEEGNEESRADDLLYHQEEIQELDISDDCCMAEQPNNESANLGDLSAESYQREISLDTDVRVDHPAIDTSFTISEVDDCEYGADIGDKHMATSLQQVAANQQSSLAVLTASRLQNSEVIEDGSWVQNTQKESSSVGSTTSQNSQVKITSSQDNQFERYNQSYTNEQNLGPSSSDTDTSGATIVPSDKPLLITEDAESQDDKSSTMKAFDNSLMTSISRNCGGSFVKSLGITRSSTTARIGQQMSIVRPLQDTVQQQTQNTIDDQTVLARATRNQPSTSQTNNVSVGFDAQAVRSQVRKVIRNLQQGGYFQNQPK